MVVPARLTRARAAWSSSPAPIATSNACSRSARPRFAVMPNAEAASYYQRTSKDHAPYWSDRMTATGLEAYLAYNGLGDAKLLAPTPLLIVHGTQDFGLLPEFAQAAYGNALGPKQLTWIETHNHVELYDQDPYVSQAADTVVAFLGERLGLGGGS